MPRLQTPYLLRAGLRPEARGRADAYPLNIPAVQQLAQIRFHPSVTFLVGENGSGKSTVMEALAMALGFSAEGGSRHAQFQTTAAAASALHEQIYVARSSPGPHDSYFLRAESFFNVASYLDAVNEGERPSLHALSHGEAFMQVLLERLRGQGLYLLDEPEAALSPSRQLAALRAIDELVHGASQFIIATHSPILLAYPHARIVQFDADGVREVAYEDTEHFVITRDFLNHHPRRLQQLLADDAP
jgi:predicted ATPase